MSVYKVRFFLFFLFGYGLVIGQNIASLELNIVNDLSEISASKKIIIRVMFSQDDRLVYREMFRFSIDSGKVRLSRWKTSVDSKSEYIEAFHQPKQVFFDSFEIEVSFRFLGDEKFLIEELTRSNIAVSYVLLDQCKKHIAKTEMLPLGALNKVEKQILSQEKFCIFDQNLSTTLNKETNKISLQSGFEKEISYLKSGEFFYAQIQDLIKDIIHSWGLFLVGIIFLLLLLSLGLYFVLLKNNLKHYYPAKIAQSVFALVPVAVAGLLYFCGIFSFSAIFFGAYLLVWGCYLVIFYDRGECFKSKLFATIGGFFIIISLPILVSGILLLRL